MPTAVHRTSRAAISIALAITILLAAFNGASQIFYQLAPMGWWVGFEGVTMLSPDKHGRQLIRVARRNGWLGGQTFSVTRYVKIQEIAADGTPINRCVSDVMSTSDRSSRPYVAFYLDEILPMRCDLSAFEGQEIVLAIAWRITLPFTIFKIAPFRLGPFVVRDGNLVSA